MSPNPKKLKLLKLYDELVDEQSIPRPIAKKIISRINELGMNELIRRQKDINNIIADQGISFTVYSDKGNIDRSWPLDIIPRVIDGKKWKQVEAGLIQRLTALNMFIDDLYNKQQILKDGIVPKDIILSSTNFRPECKGFSPKHHIWANICGTDLIRDGDEFYVLEDNLRVPSGVSYMIENRSVMKQVMPEFFDDNLVNPVDDYENQLLRMLNSMNPNPLAKNEVPEVMVLTPGVYNSAYYEHSFLAHQIGAELVEGNDLVVLDDNYTYAKTVEGLKRVDVIYRRVDDLFLDPECFRKDSTLGVKGIIRSWLDGKVSIANAPGSGVADDKVVYAYVPDIIRYYLDEEPLISNVETYLCSNPKHLSYVLANLDKLVVKPANESGGYGMLVGPHSTKKMREEFAEKIKQNPRNFVAQPTISLSTSLSLCNNQLESRHVDLRPFILQGKNHYVTTGGLTRVAMVKNSLVVNSSQGGGSKDTWIIENQTESK